MDFDLIRLDLHNNLKVLLPLNLPLSERKGKHRDAYQEFLQGSPNLVRRHLTAVSTILPRHLNQVKKVLHMFGGVGAMAQIIAQLSPDAEQIIWERDETLCRFMKEFYPDVKVVHVDDSLKRIHEFELGDTDMVCMDASMLTIRTAGLKDIWLRVAEAHVPYVWLTDSSCSKIHLNYRAYTADFGRHIEPNAESYLEAYSEGLEINTGYRIVDAMREAGATYCLAMLDHEGKTFPRPIPYL